MDTVSMTPDQTPHAEREVTLPESEYLHLRESRRMFATLLGNLPGMAFRCANRPGLPFELVSEGCLDLTGYSAEDLLGQRVTWADLLVREVTDEALQATVDSVAEHRRYQTTFQLRTASGALKWVWEQGQGIFGPDGSVLAIEGFMTDVSERVEAHELLEQRVAERTRELETMLEVSRTVASTLELDPLFETILDQIGRVIDNDSAAIGLIDDNNDLVVVAGRRNVIGARSLPALGLRFAFDLRDENWRVIAAGRQVYSPNVRGDNAVARAFRARVGNLLEPVYGHVCSYLATPLIAQQRVIGALFITSAQEDHYGPHDMDLAMATANQIAVAIENARLHEEARRLAAMEERQRLARELHDSVSQALYGIGLGAETALRVLERDPAQVTAPLRYVRELADVGLAEMRALIFELRPESLEQEGLVRAIEKQAAALGARHRIAIETELGEEPNAPLPVKEALYRIAQEAMHNAVKHASPQTIGLRLECQDTAIVLAVTDDGVGFDPSASFPGHLGLKSMPERAHRLGGQVAITSAAGVGTRVHASIPLSR